MIEHGHEAKYHIDGIYLDMAKYSYVGPFGAYINTAH